jgi:hypothetical protein
VSAESLDRTEASRTLVRVMARFDRGDRVRDRGSADSATTYARAALAPDSTITTTETLH